jgi:hypothetical protein
VIPLDELVPNFRRARDRWPGAPALQAHYETVAESYAGSAQGLIEAVKSYLECVCRTILADYGAPANQDATTTELLVAALERLGLRNTRGASRFDRVLSAHNKLADALSEVRNHDAPVAHGKDGFLDALAENHVRLYLLTGDTILSLILGAVDGSEPNLIHTREPYEKFQRFNEAIDAAVGMAAEIDHDASVVELEFKTAAHGEGLKLRVEPSRLLYGLDRAAYVEILESLPAAFAPMREVEEDEEGEAAPEPFLATRAAPIDIRRIKSYSGHFNDLKADLAAFLSEQGLREKDVKALQESLLDAFEQTAAFEWPKRDSLSARVLIGLKRVLKASKLKHPPAETLAQSLLRWFALKVPMNKVGAGRARKGGSR